MASDERPLRPTSGSFRDWSVHAPRDLGPRVRDLKLGDQVLTRGHPLGERLPGVRAVAGVGAGHVPHAVFGLDHGVGVDVRAELPLEPHDSAGLVVVIDADGGDRSDAKSDLALTTWPSDSLTDLSIDLLLLAQNGVHGGILPKLRWQWCLDSYVTDKRASVK